MKEIFKSLTEAQQIELLFSAVANTQDIITDWVEENLHEDALHDEIPNFLSTVEEFEQAFSPFKKQYLEDNFQLENFFNISIDVEAWGGSTEEGAGNFIAGSVSWDNFGKYIITKFYPGNEAYIKRHTTINPQELTEGNLLTFAFRALFTATIALTDSYYTIGLPEGVNFDEVLIAWGEYKEHSATLQDFEKTVFNPYLEKLILEASAN